MQCLTVYIFLYFSPCSLNFLTLYFIHFTLHSFIVLPDDLVFFLIFEVMFKVSYKKPEVKVKGLSQE